MSTTVGQIEYEARINTSKLRADAAETEAVVNKAADAGQSKLSSMATSIAKSSQKAALGLAAMSAALSPFLDDAVRRVDTLNNFPKVMSNMGISADDAAKASKRLVDGILGLPTTLDTASLSVQRLTTRTKDINKSTDIFLALNNAVLAGAAPMELQVGAMEQFSQAFSKGQIDMMEWRSILAAMPAQLDQVARSMNLESVDKLGEKLRDGSITMSQFSDEIIKLNSNGVGGLPSFAKQAKNATDGIGTGLTNAKTAIVRGIAGIIQAIGASNIAESISKIGSSIEKVFKFISENLGAVAVFIGTILTVAFASLAVAVIAATWPILALAAAVTGLYLLYLQLKPVIDIITGAFSSLWQFIQDNVIPIFSNYWHNYLEPLAKVLGVVIVDAIKKLIEIIQLEVEWWQKVIDKVKVVIDWFQQLYDKLFAAQGPWDKFKSFADNALGPIDELVGGIISGINDLIGKLSAGEEAGKKFGEALSRSVGNAANLIPGVGFVKSISSLFRATGGPVSAGQPYIVGEQGSELFVPDTNGQIIPHHELGDTAGGSSIVNNIGTINIAKEVDADKLIRRLTKDQEAIGKGLTPTQAYL